MIKKIATVATVAKVKLTDQQIDERIAKAQMELADLKETKRQRALEDPSIVAGRLCTLIYQAKRFMRDHQNSPHLTKFRVGEQEINAIEYVAAMHEPHYANAKLICTKPAMSRKAWLKERQAKLEKALAKNQAMLKTEERIDR